MNDQQTAICPWCQTEIVWDEELGPEEQCPHCLNELSEYRSVNLSGSEDEDAAVPQEDEEEEEAADSAGRSADADELYTMSAYEAAARYALDRQEVFADCATCGVEMLHLGQLPPSPLVNQPAGLNDWKQPLLGSKLELDAFVCPTCFAVETKLTDLARMQFVKQLTEQGE